MLQTFLDVGNRVESSVLGKLICQQTAEWIKKKERGKQLGDY